MPDVTLTFKEGSCFLISLKTASPASLISREISPPLSISFPFSVYPNIFKCCLKILAFTPFTDERSATSFVILSAVDEKVLFEIILPFGLVLLVPIVLNSVSQVLLNSL